MALPQGAGRGAGRQQHLGAADQSSSMHGGPAACLRAWACGQGAKFVGLLAGKELNLQSADKDLTLRVILTFSFF